MSNLPNPFDPVGNPLNVSRTLLAPNTGSGLPGITPTAVNAADRAAMSAAFHTPTQSQQAQFERELFTWLASPEAASLLKPMLDTALAKVGNPWVRAILALFVVPALQSEMAKLATNARTGK